MLTNSASQQLLLVEHHAITALDRRRFLEQSGYPVVRVENGEAAIALMDRGESFSVVIVDVELKGSMNTADTAVALRKRSRIPIVFLVNSDPDEDDRKSRFEAVSYAPRGEISKLIPVLLSLGIRPLSRLQTDSTVARGRGSGPEYGSYFYESIVRTMSDVVTVIDEFGIVRYTSPSIEQQFGYRPADVIGRSARKFLHPDDRAAVDEFLRAIGKESLHSETIECRHLLPDGKYVWVEGRAADYSDANISRGVLVTYHDVSGRVEARTMLETALSEKQLLLTEVHHRIKNDLNLVNSMLSLHAARLESPASSQALDEARDRIGVMGDIYEQLYRNDLVGEVDLKALVGRLVDDMRRAGVYSNVHIQIDVSPLRLSTRLAISIGLIVNEIVTNSLKYAAPEGGPIEISGSIAPSSDGAAVKLVISDSGSGFPDELLKRRSHGLGITIIGSLAEQHNGDVSLANDSGAVVTVTLPLTA